VSVFIRKVTGKRFISLLHGKSVSSVTQKKPYSKAREGEVVMQWTDEMKAKQGERMKQLWLNHPHKMKRRAKKSKWSYYARKKLSESMKESWKRRLHKPTKNGTDALSRIADFLADKILSAMTEKEYKVMRDRIIDKVESKILGTNQC
jgi:hypothetical protein